MVPSTASRMTSPIIKSYFKILFDQVSNDEHVTFIERGIRHVKEVSRATMSHLPYLKLTKRLVIGLVIAMVFWINAFPPANGVSQTIGHRELLTGVKTTMARVQYEFGNICKPTKLLTIP